MPSPVSHKKHSRPQSLIVIWLGNYFLATPGTDIGDNGTVRLDEENEPQDAMLRILPGVRRPPWDDDYIGGRRNWWPKWPPRAKVTTSMTSFAPTSATASASI